MASDNQVSAFARPAEGVEQTDLPVEPFGRGGVATAVAPTLDDAVRPSLAERLDLIGESPDPVAELDTAIESVAREIDDSCRTREPPSFPAGSEEEIASAIQTLVTVALEADDPVAALEDGADSLAEALAAREALVQDWQRAVYGQEIDRQAAYRHARLHRVTELMDVGYGLDQAVSIANANEAEIRARAVAAGRDPMEPIYEYAVLNGYRGTRAPGQASPTRGEASLAAVGKGKSEGPLSAMEALAALSEDAFADATRGDRWHRLMSR